jgi:hypothetical protein
MTHLLLLLATERVVVQRPSNGSPRTSAFVTRL